MSFFISYNDSVGSIKRTALYVSQIIFHIHSLILWNIKGEYSV